MEITASIDTRQKAMQSLVNALGFSLKDFEMDLLNDLIFFMTKRSRKLKPKIKELRETVPNPPTEGEASIPHSQEILLSIVSDHDIDAEKGALILFLVSHFVPILEQLRYMRHLWSEILDLYEEFGLLFNEESVVPYFDRFTNRFYDPNDPSAKKSKMQQLRIDIGKLGENLAKSKERDYFTKTQPGDLLTSIKDIYEGIIKYLVIFTGDLKNKISDIEAKYRKIWELRE